MENEFSGNVSSYGYDEFYCFHISDFRQGDAIIYLNEQRQKERAVVMRTSHRDLTIRFHRAGGESGICHINDVVYLTDGKKKWLS